MKSFMNNLGKAGLGKYVTYFVFHSPALIPLFAVGAKCIHIALDLY